MTGNGCAAIGSDQKPEIDVVGTSFTERVTDKSEIAALDSVSDVGAWHGDNQDIVIETNGPNVLKR